MDLAAIGELGLIGAIRRRAGSRGGAWRVAIGDDAAVLRPRPGTDVVATTDALVEGVHFRFETTDARSLGHKALAVNLSDLGAMGARPTGCLLALALPPAADPRKIEGVVAGLLAEARAAGCPLVGGDTVASPAWTLVVTAFGEVPAGRALGRGGARPGDRVLVTGELGGSAMGLRLLQGAAPATPRNRALVRRHRRPRPPYAVGPRLARRSFVTAAIDLSDGLSRDAGHVARESGVRLDVHLARLPLARGLRAAARELGLDPLALALHGGEDYELLFCVRPGAPSAAALGRQLGVRLTEVGGVARGRGVRTLAASGEARVVRGQGFDHFKTTSAPAEE